MKKLKSIKRSKKIRRKQNPHNYYEPNGKCEEFIKLVGSNEIFVLIYSAANGVGKTALGANLVANICYETKNPYFMGLPLFENFPFVKRGRVISDPTTVNQILVPELHKWFPQGRYTTDKSGKLYEYNWRTDTGFLFDVMTYEQQVKEFEAATLGFAWFDEPPPMAIYKATIARMRAGGIIFITETPLSGSAWLYDNLVASPDRVDVRPILEKYKLKEWNKKLHQLWIQKLLKMNIEERLGS